MKTERTGRQLKRRIQHTHRETASPTETSLTAKNAYWLFPELEVPLFAGEDPMQIAQAIIKTIQSHPSDLRYARYTTTAIERSQIDGTPNPFSPIVEDIFLSHEAPSNQLQTLKEALNATGFKPQEKLMRQRTYKVNGTEKVAIFSVTRYARITEKQVMNYKPFGN